MVCSEKTRNLILSKSGKTIKPPLRTLDELPMKWKLTDSTKAADRCRSAMSANSTTSTQAQRTSHCLFTQSKRLFDEAFLKAKETRDFDAELSRLPPVSSLREVRTSHCSRDDNLLSLRETMRSNCSLRPHTVKPKHTGPTTYGSPLYNSMSQTVFDRIHSKPLLSEPPPEYFRATPDIEKCLKESNDMFRVTKAWSPNDDLSDEHYTARTHESYANFLLLRNRQSSRPGSSCKPALTPVAQLLKDDRTNESEARSKTNIVPGINIEAATDLIGENTKEFDDNGSQLKDQLKIKVGSKSPSSTRSSRTATTKSPRSPKMPPKNTTPKTEQKEKKTRNKKRTKQVTELEEEIDPEPEFPDFICPSSELKSREAYIRRWIRQNTFTKCNRSVPLE